MLFLLFQVGKDRYALEARQAVEVVPYLALKKIPQAPPGVAGIFNYRGQPVPAVDLSELTFGAPARERLSTRIILLKFANPESPAQTRLLGLVAERATEIMRREEKEFVDSGVRSGAAPYLGPVLMDEKGVVQLIRTQHLLTHSLRELVFAGTEAVEP